MHKLIIHQPKNFESRYYRAYNYFFDALIEQIKSTNDVIDNRFFKYANSKFYPVLLQSQDTFFDNTHLYMLECEMIIENYDTKGIKVLSMSDIFTSSTLSLQDNVLCNKILIAQFNRNNILNNLENKNNIYKYSPWVYFPQLTLDYDIYYKRRKERSIFTDKMYFRGSCLEHRKIISYLSPDLFHGGEPIGGFERYVEELLDYKIGVSVGGRGEFCYRDVEYMAMGIPFIRFKFNNEMAAPLIPNVHYISVDRPSDIVYDHECGPDHAKLLEKRFLEVKDDVEFLNFISNNARKYYEQYLKLNNCVHHTIKLLELDNWS